MAINSVQLNQAASIAGLGTTTFNVVTAGEYSVGCESTLPQSSALQIVINQNGSPIVTVGGAVTNPTPTQPSLAANAKLACAATDVITVVLSSANAVDGLPNSVKSIINIFQGE